MARPREFDEAEVIDRALAAFWAHGYDSTSLADLTEATGLVKGSIYKGFGDKKRLFMLALDSYLSSGLESLGEIDATAPSGREAVEQVLAGVAGAATRTGLRCGCLAVNSGVELGPHDSEVRSWLRRYTRDKEKLIAGFVVRGTSDGSLRSDLDPEQTARLITVITDGLQAQGKIGLSRVHANDIVATALATLTPPTRSTRPHPPAS